MKKIGRIVKKIYMELYNVHKKVCGCKEVTF